MAAIEAYITAVLCAQAQDGKSWSPGPATVNVRKDAILAYGDALGVGCTRLLLSDGTSYVIAIDHEELRRLLEER